VERSTAREMDFGQATRPLLGHLVAVARRILGDEDAAWDAVQEALVSLWLIGEIPTNLRAWLGRAVIHRSLHLARSRSRRRRHEDRVRFERPEPSDRDDPSRYLEGEELGGFVRQALTRIAPQYRAVLVLHVVEQMDYEAIAAALQIPVGTVRSRLNRSRKALRDVLIRIAPEDVDGVLPR
jgi:RNA polymerase sigma-70 factor, ECF subfamily